jgi:HSP20 family protein
MLKSLITRNENPFMTWQREMNSLFDRFNRDMDFSNSELEQFSPRVELKEKENGYVVRAEIPGMSEKDINVSLRDNNLILEGEKKSESKKEDKGQYFSEFSYGSFYRSIPLEEEVNPDNVKATYRNGVLTVEIETLREIEHKSKKIPIINQ